MAGAAAVSNFDLLGWLKILLFAAVLFFGFKILRKFNLLGDNQDTKDAKAISETKGFDKPIQQDDDLKAAALKKLHAKTKFTNADLKTFKTLLPNFEAMPGYVTQIVGARHILGNDPAPVLNVYRNLSSQFEINYFNQLFSAVVKSDAFKFLDKLLHDSDLADLYRIIKEKPLV